MRITQVGCQAALPPSFTARWSRRHFSITGLRTEGVGLQFDSSAEREGPLRRSWLDHRLHQGPWIPIPTPRPIVLLLAPAELLTLHASNPPDGAEGRIEGAPDT